MTGVAVCTRKQRKAFKKNLQRSFRVIEYFDVSGIIPDCPVQVNEGYIISDSDTHELFASFSFQNSSDKAIKSLDIRLFFYQSANVPYEKRSFTYSYSGMTFGIRKGTPMPKKSFFGHTVYPDTIAVGESFGRSAYIRIPDSYFRKIELEISKVTFEDGTSVSPKLIVKNHSTPMNRLGDEALYAFSRLNIYAESEEVYPTAVIPQFGMNAWLCCCGHKNLATSEKCERCRRDRDWQKNAFDEKTLSDKVVELKAANDYYRNDKSKYDQSRKFETEEELQRKAKEYEKVMNHVAEQERKKARDFKMLFPKILLLVALILGIALICQLIINPDWFSKIFRTL